MKGFNNLKISAKLLIGFVIVALIAGAVGGFGMINIKLLDDKDTYLYEQMTVPLGEMIIIAEAYQRARGNVKDILLTTDPVAIADYEGRIKERMDEVHVNLASYEKTLFSDEGKQLTAQMKQDIDAYEAVVARIIALQKEGKHQEAYDLMNGEGGDLRKSVEASYRRMMEIKVETAGQTAADNTAQANKTMMIMGILVAVAMALAVGLGLFLSNNISKPLLKSVQMIQEMSKGHLGMRMNMDTKDEVGVMAKAMDAFADDLQLNVIGVLNSIAKGDVSMTVVAKDDKDEISPAMAKTIEIINGLIKDVNRLIKATQEGKLDTRGDASAYSGSWSELVKGLNGLIDAFVAPINVTAEYVERIGKGDIPPKITDTYYGDFNEIKNNLNGCIDNINALVTDTNTLVEAAVLGKLDTRADATKHGGDYAKIVSGVNKTLDAVIGPLNVAAEYVDRISKGDIPQKITDNYNGDFNEIKNNINVLIDSLNSFTEDMKHMSLQHDLGDIDVVVPAEKFQGTFKTMALGVNGMVNGHIAVKKKAMACIAEFAKGNFDVELEKFPGKKAFINENIEAMRKNLKDVNHEVGSLVNAAVDGKLSARANDTIFQGDWQKLVMGLNSLLEAIIEPIKEASGILTEMSNGNLQKRVTGNYKGDHADIKNALNDTLDSLSSYVSEISYVLNEMAGSNLDVGITGDYKGDFSAIKDALNRIVSALNEVLGEMGNAADQVAGGARQVSDGSQALSQGSTEQASAVEELTASITQIAAQTKQNAANAGQANDLANQARVNADQGNQYMQGMLKSMSDINDSSNNISKIIKVIDEIAFQTNILALNAAVEAARAGQHGKGFAVVAEEVRNLAARSANAAKETTAMIEGSIAKVEDGTKIANETAGALVKIVEGVAKAANLVNEIATASNEQANAIFQINKGVEQVSQVVQTNSATAEQSAAASEELSGQAEMLKEMVGNFRLKHAVGSGVMAKSTGRGFETKKSSRKADKGTKMDSQGSRIYLSDNEFEKY